MLHRPPAQSPSTGPPLLLQLAPNPPLPCIDGSRNRRCRPRSPQYCPPCCTRRRCLRLPVVSSARSDTFRRMSKGWSALRLRCSCKARLRNIGWRSSLPREVRRARTRSTCARGSQGVRSWWTSDNACSLRARRQGCQRWCHLRSSPSRAPEARCRHDGRNRRCLSRSPWCYRR